MPSPSDKDGLVPASFARIIPSNRHYSELGLKAGTLEQDEGMSVWDGGVADKRSGKPVNELEFFIAPKAVEKMDLSLCN
jgi:hypothetical protein